MSPSRAGEKNRDNTKKKSRTGDISQHSRANNFICRIFFRGIENKQLQDKNEKIILYNYVAQI